jgi:hypothetical protein
MSDDASSAVDNFVANFVQHFVGVDQKRQVIVFENIVPILSSSTTAAVTTATASLP